MSERTTTAGDDAIRYAYKASLIGAAHQFELTGQGLSWRFAGRTGLWPYADIAAIRLSYRPVSMQAKRFRADITHRDGRRLSIISVSWQTAALMAPQSEAYRAFILGLHARLASSGSNARLTAGLGRFTYGAALAAIALLAVAMAGLLVRALVIAEWSGALFLIGFAALFAWYVGGFITRNRPRSYTFTEIPAALLP
ncbi:hypothetical protein [Bradyrhizobium oligotrophicum]|uniref:hypothetical protein n=1 Tax=Bradyrhizobium TaxID=374 RepID=UPI003EBFEE10